MKTNGLNLIAAAIIVTLIVSACSTAGAEVASAVEQADTGSVSEYNSELPEPHGA